MDYGLLGGLAEGIKSGMASYKDARQSAQEDAFRKRQLGLEEKSKGLQFNDQTGGYEQTAEAKYNKKYEGLLGAAKEGLVPIEKDGMIEGFQRDQGLMKPKDVDPVEQAYKKAQTQKLYAETAQLGKQATGKQLPPDKVLAVQEGKNIPNMLSDIKGVLANSTDMFGPVAGRLASANPYNEKAKTMDSQLRIASQSFGRYMEGGVLRKEDEEKYRHMFPQLSDTPEVASNKLALVDRMLKEKQLGDVGALKSSGYDVAGFGEMAQSPALPGILTQAPQGLIPQAQAASPQGMLPKKGVVENGFEFLGGDPANQSNWKKVSK